MMTIYQQTPMRRQSNRGKFSDAKTRIPALETPKTSKGRISESTDPSVQDDKMIALGQSVLGESVVGSGLTALEEEALGGGGGDVYVRMDDSRVDGSSE